MRTKAIAIAAVLGAVALGGSALPASAATECFRENVIRPGGFHEIVQRCVTRHIVAPVPRTVTTTRTVTREYVTAPVTRFYDDDVYYGSSYPARYYDPMLGY
jgi:hypothetical protein